MIYKILTIHFSTIEKCNLLFYLFKKNANDYNSIKM